MTMKLFGGTCAFLFALGMTSPAVSADKPPVVLINAGMEKVAEGKRLPTGYHALSRGIAVVDDGVAFEGKRSIKLVPSGTRQHFGVIQQPAVHVPEGKIMRVRVRCRTHDLNGGDAFIMVYRYPPPFKKAFYSTRRISGTNDWTVLEAEVPAKKGGVSLQIRLMVYASTGRVWWDALEVLVEDKK